MITGSYLVHLVHPPSGCTQTYGGWMHFRQDHEYRSVLDLVTEHENLLVLRIVAFVVCLLSNLVANKES